MMVGPKAPVGRTQPEPSLVPVPQCIQVMAPGQGCSFIRNDGFLSSPFINSSLSLSQIKKNSAAAGFPWCFSSPILCVESYHFFLSLRFCFLKYLAHLAVKYFVFLISALDLSLAHPKTLGGTGCTQLPGHKHGTLRVSPRTASFRSPGESLLESSLSLNKQAYIFVYKINFCSLLKIYTYKQKKSIPKPTSNQRSQEYTGSPIQPMLFYN